MNSRQDPLAWLKWLWKEIAGALVLLFVVGGVAHLISDQSKQPAPKTSAGKAFSSDFWKGTHPPTQVSGSAAEEVRLECSAPASNWSPAQAMSCELDTTHWRISCGEHTNLPILVTTKQLTWSFIDTSPCFACTAEEAHRKLTYSLDRSTLRLEQTGIGEGGYAVYSCDLYRKRL